MGERRASIISFGSRRSQSEVGFFPEADMVCQTCQVHLVPEANIDASFDHFISTTKQREDNARRLGRLLRPIMIMANSKEALPSGLTGVKAPAKHF